MQLQPYLFFDGRAEEAITFYQRAVNAKVEMMMRFKDGPPSNDPNCAPGNPDKVMHATLKIGDTTVMASDGDCKGRPTFAGFALSLTVPTEAEADGLFAALADSGQIQMPLMKTFFSPKFGMLADRFGVSWMIHVAP